MYRSDPVNQSDLGDQSGPGDGLTLKTSLTLQACYTLNTDAGVNAWEAIALANLHPRVKILKPGPGVGGHCIPVDPWFLAEAYPRHSSLLVAARETNDTQAGRMLQRMIATGSLKAGDKLAILGAAYKADIDGAWGTAWGHVEGIPQGP